MEIETVLTAPDFSDTALDAARGQYSG